MADPPHPAPTGPLGQFPAPSSARRPIPAAARPAARRPNPVPVTEAPVIRTGIPVISMHARMEITGAPAIGRHARAATMRACVTSIHARLATADIRLNSTHARMEIAGVRVISMRVRMEIGGACVPATRAPVTGTGGAAGRHVVTWPRMRLPTRRLRRSRHCECTLPVPAMFRPRPVGTRVASATGLSGTYGKRQMAICWMAPHLFGEAGT